MKSETQERAFEIEAKSRFFEANRRIVEYEMCPGNTVTFLSEVDLTEVERVRRAAGDQRASYTAFVAKAVGLALRDVPYANRRVCRRLWKPFANPRLQRFNRCDVAIASERDIPSAEGVAFVDVLRDADRLSLHEITDWMRALSAADVDNNKQWREFSNIIRRLPNWLSTILIRMPYLSPGMWAKYRGGAVLISSPAKYGVDAVAATWSWPLGVSFGLVKDRPVVRNGQVLPCPTFILTLNFDRRVMAGAQGAHFFKRIVDALECAETHMTSDADRALVSQQSDADANKIKLTLTEQGLQPNEHG